MHSCKDCGARYKEASGLIQHRKSVHKGIRYSCEFCLKQVTRKYTLQLHMNRHLGEKEYKCDKCPKSYVVLSELKHHSLTHLGDAVKNSECPVCGKGFINRHAMNKHKVIHSTDRPFKCVLCGKGFKRNGELKDHARRFHTGEKRFQCSVCTKKFGTAVELRSHQQIHEDRPLQQCPKCNKTIIKSTRFNSHFKREHTAEGAIGRDYECIFCQKGYKWRHDLFRHILAHIGEKPWNCDLCDNEYYTASDKMAHLRRVHIREKTHACNICGKTFVNNGDLKGHLVTHSEERSFQCDACPSRFKTAKGLKQHKKGVHKIRSVKK